MRFILTIIFLHFFDCMQAQPVSFATDLGFKDINDCNCDWIANKANSIIEKVDSGIKISYRRFTIGANGKMQFGLSKHVILPNRTIDKLKVTLTIKNSAKSKVVFLIKGLDKEEKVILEKTVLIPQTEGWANFFLEDLIPDVKAFDIVIRYEGSMDTAQLIELKKITISLDGQDFLAFPDSNSNVKSSEFWLDKVIPIQSQNVPDLIKYIPDLSMRKIIGLGESTHGSKSIADMRLSFIKDLVQNHQCRAILLEVPVSDALLYDLYAQRIINDQGLVEGHLKRTFAGWSSLISLLNWLREYNLNSDRKVYVKGCDNTVPGTNFALMDYFVEVLGWKEADPYLYQLCSNNISAIKSLAQQDSSLKIKLGPKNFKYLINVLSDKYSDNYEDFRDNRDSAMFLRTVFLDSLLIKPGEKIAILAHSAHLQKIPLIQRGEIIKPLGSFLGDTYDKEYYAINFNFGTGSFVQDSCLSVKAILDTLKTTPQSSFEHAALASTHNAFFLSTDYLRGSVMTTAYINRFSQNKSHFRFASIKKRFDAIAFQKVSVPFTDFEHNLIKYQLNFYRSNRQKYQEIWRRYMSERIKAE